MSKTYEYKIVYIPPDRVIDMLTEFGKNNWDLVTVFQGQGPAQYFFKREIKREG